MKIFAIIVGKLVVFAGKIFKRGSSLPGKLALKIDKNLLKKFKTPKSIIAVTRFIWKRKHFITYCSYI